MIRNPVAITHPVTGRTGSRRLQSPLPSPPGVSSTVPRRSTPRTYQSPHSGSLNRNAPPVQSLLSLRLHTQLRVTNDRPSRVSSSPKCRTSTKFGESIPLLFSHINGFKLPILSNKPPFRQLFEMLHLNFMIWYA